MKLPVEGGFAKPPKTRHNSKENRKTAPKPHCTFENRANGGLPRGSKFSRKQAYKDRPIGGKPPNLATLPVSASLHLGSPCPTTAESSRFTPAIQKPLM